MTLQMTIFFLILATSFSFSFQLSRIQESCSDDTDCPANSACRPRGCKGMQCLCDEDFISSSDGMRCKNAGRIGASCFPGTDVECISIMAFCDSSIDYKCNCQLFYRQTNQSACTYRGLKAIGENCTEVNECAEIKGECKDGFCQCKDGYRPLTTAEFWADPNYFDECVEVGTSLEFCNGSRVAPLITKTTLTPTATFKTTNTPTTIETPTTTTTTPSSTAAPTTTATSTSTFASTTTATSTSTSTSTTAATSTSTSTSTAAATSASTSTSTTTASGTPTSTATSTTTATASPKTVYVSTRTSTSHPTPTAITTIAASTATTVKPVSTVVTTKAYPTTETTTSVKDDADTEGDDLDKTQFFDEGTYSSIIIASAFIMLLYIVFLAILIILRCKRYVIILTNES